MAVRRAFGLFSRPERQLPGDCRGAHLGICNVRCLSAGETLVVASHNPGKVREIEDLVRPFGLSAVSASTLDLPEPEETGATFAENAVIKAQAAAVAANLPALADDSGLEVDVLEGAPGIRSARWAGPDKDFAVAMQRVWDEVARCDGPSGQNLRANFTCALCIGWPDERGHTFEGKVFGRLVWPPRGDKGFGYDPMFAPDGHLGTFGEMEPQEKHAMSHRAIAFARFVDAYLTTR